MAPLLLQLGAWRAEIAPDLGGSLLSLSWADQALLRPAPADILAQRNVRLSACFPMVPYGNRIAAGRFRWGGEDYAVAANFPGSPHPMHGVGWQRPWLVETADRSSCRLTLACGADGDWPFPFTARQDIALSGDGLALTLSVRNDAHSDAPGGIGYHPFFPRRGGDWLRFGASGVWLNGPDLLPDRLVTDQPDWDYRQGQSTAARSLDNDFAGWQLLVEIGADRGPTLRVTADQILSMLRVYTPPERDYFAVEPVSHGANALNRPHGMANLAPGESLAGRMTLTVAAP